MTRSLLLAFLAGLVLAACQEETAPPPPVRPILSSRVAIDAADQQSFEEARKLLAATLK